MARKKQLPKVLYAVWNYDSPDDPFFDHSDDPSLLAEKGETITVGRYELINKVKLINTTKVEQHLSAAPGSDGTN